MLALHDNRPNRKPEVGTLNTPSRLWQLLHDLFFLALSTMSVSPKHRAWATQSWSRQFIAWVPITKSPPRFSQVHTSQTVSWIASDTKLYPQSTLGNVIGDSIDRTIPTLLYRPHSLCQFTSFRRITKSGKVYLTLYRHRCSVLKGMWALDWWSKYGIVHSYPLLFLSQNIEYDQRYSCTLL